MVMVEIGIVPTAKGYAAVGLRKTLGKTNTLIIRAPFHVSDDLKTRMLGRLSREAAGYLWQVGKWEGIGLVVFLWAVTGLITLATSRIWDYGTKMALLYGWVRVWFLADGVWLFLPWVFKILHRRRANRIRKYFKGEQQIISQIEDWPQAVTSDMIDEREYILDKMEKHPELIPYYKQMLEVDPPRGLDWYPATLLGRIRNWIFGTPIRLPHMIYYIGRDAC